MKETALYSTRIIKTFCEYMGKFHPDINMMQVMDYAGITNYQLEDEGHWLTQSQTDRFYEILSMTVCDPDIARKAGQYTPFSKAAGTVSQYTLGFMTPATAYTVVGRLYPHMSRGSTLRTRSLGSNKVEVVAVQNPGVTEKPYQCQNRLGVFEGIAKLFTGKLATIKHDTCMHISGNRCVYTISWEETPAFIWKRIANYASVGSAIVAILLIFALPSDYSAIAVLSIVPIIMGLHLYKMSLEKEELATAFVNHRALAYDLLDEINTRYNNSTLIQEIGQASSNILDIDQLMAFTLDAVKKRLYFDRGLIMLANAEGNRLIYKAGYGYGPNDEALLKSAEFHLDNPESKGPFVVAHKEQRPFLVNDVESIKQDISDRSLAFSRQLNVESFICVPIVYEGKSEGILAVDNHRLKRPLNQSDVNIFLGIASQIGVSINNARSYQRVSASERRFRALSENAPDIIYTTDTKGALTYVNPAWERLLGHAREDVIGMYFVHFVKEEDKGKCIEIFKEIRDNRRHVGDLEGAIVHRDGSERLFNMSGAPNLDALGNLIGVVGTFRDVTKQRALENQLMHASKMEAIGTLTGGIAHDFNNIIQAVSGYNQLLLMKKDKSDPDWKYLDNIDRLNQRATDLIKQLLIFSRKVESKLQPMNLNDEIKEYYKLLKETIPKMISVDLIIGADLRKIKGDPVQIGQVLLNLAINARDAMPDGGNLTIETMNLDLAQNNFTSCMELTPGSYVLLRVSDTGHGMDKETMEHIFEPFYSTKSIDQGTGLGLAVVYGIVSSHGGHIWCESDPGRGTAFNIVFPALGASECGDAAVQNEAPNGAVAGAETILLVDDEEFLLETNRSLLEHYGYRVVTAANGEEAIEIFQKERKTISLVILDMLMPGMGGIRCLTELLGIDPKVKVIISSGYMTAAKQQEAAGKGAVGFLQKPYRHDDILTAIRGILDQDNATLPLQRISGV